MNKVQKLFQNYYRMPVQVKASMWYAACNVLQKGMSFVTVPIYIRMLTVSECGRYVTFLSWKDIVMIFATFNLFYGVYTKYIIDHEKDRDGYTSCMQCLCTLLTAAAFIVYMLMHKFWNNLFAADIKLMLLVFMYCLFTPAYSFWLARQRAEYNYVRMVFVSLIVILGVPVTSLCLLYITDLRERAVIYGYLSVQLLTGFFFYVWHLVRGKMFYNREYWTSGLRFNLPLLPHYLSLLILSQSDRIMITKFAGSDKAGIYNLAYQVSVVMNVVADAMNGALTPWVYRKLKEKNYEKLKSVPKAACIFLQIISAAVILSAPEIVQVIGTKEYLEAVWIIPPVTASAYFVFCYGLFCNIEFYYFRTKYVTLATFAGAGMNLILNLFFIPQAGYLAAGYTTAVSYFITFSIHYLVYESLRKCCMDGNSVYDTLFIWRSCILLFACSCIGSILYRLPAAVRYGLILFFIAVTAIFKDKVASVISEIKTAE